MQKLKVGVYNFTCCEGCTIMLVEAFNKKLGDWLEKIDFVDFRTLKPSNGIHETDVALVEGAISTEEEVEKLKEIRSKTKKLVTFGSGATTGWPSDLRNKFDVKRLNEISKDLEKFRQIDKVSPVKRFVKVDEELNGCPVVPAIIIAKMEEWVHDKRN